jgi:hypothetical protein
MPGPWHLWPMPGRSWLQLLHLPTVGEQQDVTGKRSAAVVGDCEPEPAAPARISRGSTQVHLDGAVCGALGARTTGPRGPHVAVEHARSSPPLKPYPGVSILNFVIRTGVA